MCCIVFVKTRLKKVKLDLLSSSQIRDLQCDLSQILAWMHQVMSLCMLNHNGPTKPLSAAMIMHDHPVNVNKQLAVNHTINATCVILQNACSTTLRV